MNIKKNSMGSVGGELLRENTKYKKVSGCTDQTGFLPVMGWEGQQTDQTWRMDVLIQQDSQ